MTPTANRPRVVAFGDNTTDYFVDRGRAYPGGNCVNFSVFCARLGVDSTYLGPFGNDLRAARLRSALADEQVTVSAFSTSNDGATGLARVQVVNGDITGEGLNGGGVGSKRPIPVSTDIIAHLKDFDLVHSSVYSHLDSQIERIRSAGTLVAFDFSSEAAYRSDDYLERVLPFVDWAQFSGSALSDHEVDSFAAHLQENFAVPIVVITRGAADIVVRVNGETARVPISPLPPGLPFIDTLGCGDALFAASVVNLLRSGWSRDHLPSPIEVREAVAAATAYSALQCSTEAGFGHGYPVSLDSELANQ